MNRRAASAILLTLCLLVSSPLFAQTTEVLSTGPDIRKGIPYLSPNVISYYAVSYRTAGRENQDPSSRVSASAGEIRVFYTDTPIVAYSSWGGSPCTALKALTVEDTPTVLYYRAAQGWSLFFAFPPGYQVPCSFAETFVTRFNYFLGITRGAALSSFPAVLNLR